MKGRRITPKQARNGHEGYLVLTICVDGKDLVLLDQLADKTQMNRSEVIRHAVRAWKP